MPWNPSKAWTTRAIMATGQDDSMNNTRSLLIPPITHSGETHHIHIVNNIRRMICNGDLQKGDLLPSERELAARFNVSRVPVREAVKILEFIGVLRRERARGLYVNEVDLRHTMNQFDFIFINTPAAFEELFEFRQAIEIQAAISAAKFRTEDDLVNIESQLILEGRQGAIESTQLKAATEFHCAIAHASQNSLFRRAFDFLFELHVISAFNNMREKVSLLEVHTEHKLIFECIQNQDHGAAGQAMRMHMNNARKRWK